MADVPAQDNQLLGLTMIPGTAYSPAKAFINFAHHFFEALANDDFQSALSKLDSSQDRWSKKMVKGALKKAIGEESVSSGVGLKDSACPKIEQLENGYILHHRIPVNGK